MRALDRLLRGRGEQRAATLAALVLAGGLLYGAAMGSFGLRPLQALYSSLKVPLLVLASTAICLPAFYVLNVLLGLGADFARALRGVLAAQATLAVALAALAPLTLLGYVSSASYRFAVLLNGACFLLATWAGQATLSRSYRILVARNPRHRIGRVAWVVLYVFVAIQAAWMLRPYVGAPGLPTRFLRDEGWNNAYVIVGRTLWEFFAG